jgi:hypothetical protein
VCADEPRQDSGQRRNAMCRNAETVARACPHGKHVVSSTKRSDLPIINFFLNHRAAAGASSGAGGLAFLVPHLAPSSGRKQPLKPPSSPSEAVAAAQSQCAHAQTKVCDVALFTL